MKKLNAWIVISLLLTCSPVNADPNKPYDKAYAAGAGRKLERGVSNLTMGWMEVPKQITVQGRQRGPAEACLLGPVIGLGNAAGRALAGVYETATFMLPAPSDFTAVASPEFVIEDKLGATKTRS